MLCNNWPVLLVGDRDVKFGNSVFIAVTNLSCERVGSSAFLSLSCRRLAAGVVLSRLCRLHGVALSAAMETAHPQFDVSPTGVLSTCSLVVVVVVGSSSH